jgi:putative SOS response-associated peptidase YedK
MAKRRCLVPADGFYEWRGGPQGKTPFLFRPGAGGLIALAAVWEHWEAPGGENRDGFAILTVAANSDVAPVHHRMPVVVAPADFAAWLAPGTPADVVRALVRPAPADSLRSYAVSSRVNSVSQDDAGLVEPARTRQESP